jgi:ADP-heptose:LPS heptosyltransferase
MRSKQLLTELAYSLTDSAARLSAGGKQVPKTLLLVKTDELGDYILFRDALRVIRNSSRFKNHRITLVGNAGFKQWFDVYDKEYVDDAIWVNKKKFSSSLKYRFETLRSIRNAGYETVVNCILTRNAFTDDTIVSVTGAKTRIGINDPAGARNSLYTQLVDNPDERLFEFYRNKIFLSELLSLPAGEIDLSLRIRKAETSRPLKAPYLIVFAGAGKRDKRWQPQKFAEVINRAWTELGIQTVMLGSKIDQEDSLAVTAAGARNTIDLTGKTSIAESLNWLQHATVALSVDTGSVHMATAVGCPVVSMFSGKHYGRFGPYPSEVDPNFRTIYSKDVQTLIDRKDPLTLQPDSMPNTTIQDITVDQVWDQLLPVLCAAHP